MRQSHLLKHQKARESVVERATEQAITPMRTASGRRWPGKKSKLKNYA